MGSQREILVDERHGAPVEPLMVDRFTEIYRWRAHVFETRRCSGGILDHRGPGLHK